VPNSDKSPKIRKLDKITSKIIKIMTCHTIVDQEGKGVDVISIPKYSAVG
jgi:hypothetical protein